MEELLTVSNRMNQPVWEYSDHMQRGNYCYQKLIEH